MKTFLFYEGLNVISISIFYFNSCQKVQRVWSKNAFRIKESWKKSFCSFHCLTFNFRFHLFFLKVLPQSFHYKAKWFLFFRKPFLVNLKMIESSSILKHLLSVNSSTPSKLPIITKIDYRRNSINFKKYFEIVILMCVTNVISFHLNVAFTTWYVPWEVSILIYESEHVHAETVSSDHFMYCMQRVWQSCNNINVEVDDKMKL